MCPRTFRVVVTDDQTLVRQAISELARNEADLGHVGQLRNAEEAAWTGVRSSSVT
jgi:DNA-binding NarL/FixJ family response regulator